VGDIFYSSIVALGRACAFACSRARVVGAEHARRSGAYILASSHLSPYDVGLLMGHTPRRLDFVSIVEMFRHPFLRWFFSRMNAFPLDRHRADPKTVRIILERLSRGRVVAMFPEGRVRPESESVLHGGAFKPGVARLAKLAGVRIVPAIVLGGRGFHRLSAHLPLRRTRYAIAFGPAIVVEDEARAEHELAEAFVKLYEQLREGDQVAPPMVSMSS
jgi:1-acyl-sn-glycerol-3-phosphate acyltransferase